MDNAEEKRLQLMLGLKGNLEPKMWEYNIFFDFLNEKHTNDELHFYLNARYCKIKYDMCVTVL